MCSIMGYCGSGLSFKEFKQHFDATKSRGPDDSRIIDTGMGLERLACVMQGVDNLFEVDTIQNIMTHISKIAGVTYHNDPKADVSLRVITDHIRSTTFMIADGVIPSNEGRGYVLRRHFSSSAELRMTSTEPALWTSAPTTGLSVPAMARKMARKFSPIEKVRFMRMVVIIRRDSAIRCGSSFTSSSTSAISAASTAISRPTPPMEMPTSAFLSAGASFAPSPIMQTGMPFA